MPEKTAYLIMGHGREIIKSRKIVPPGCTLVVEVHSGEVNYTNFDRILFHKNKKILLDPINNYNELVKSITSTQKTLAIYEAGSEYPDFMYTILSSWEYGEAKYVNRDEIILTDSGVLKYPFEMVKPNHRLPEKEIYNKLESPDIFVNKYRNSVYPTKYSINNYIYKNNLNSLGEVVKAIKYDGFLNIKQSDLFNVLGTGVYYNLVCRATSEKILEMAEYINTVNGINTKLRGQVLKNNIRNPIKTRKRTNKYFVPEIMDQIEEAELHRKPYIEKLELNSPLVYLKKEISKLKETEKELLNKINYYKSKGSMYKTIHMFEYNKLLSTLKDTQNKLEEKEKNVVEEPETDHSTENYTWEKVNNKWGKLTVKNRNNRGKLPEGWKVYSTNKEKWYKSPSGELVWTRPETNNDPLPYGWSLETNGKATWYKAPSGKVQWTRPVLKTNISDSKGELPYGWLLETNGDAIWYKSPSGELQWTRPEIVNNPSALNVLTPVSNNPVFAPARKFGSQTAKVAENPVFAPARKFGSKA